jgi:hypothetical protein
MAALLIRFPWNEVRDPVMRGVIKVLRTQKRRE